VVYRVIWTRKSLEDLREIHNYIAKDSKRYAQIQVERIQTSALKTGRFPEIGRIVPEFPKGAWRELLIGNYRVIYRAESMDSKILVLAVVHGRQLLKESMISPE
jgi:plasmid stabilization system protein ParE